MPLHKRYEKCACLFRACPHAIKRGSQDGICEQDKLQILILVGTKMLNAPSLIYTHGIWPITHTNEARAPTRKFQHPNQQD